MAPINSLVLSLNSLSLNTKEPSSNLFGGHEHTASCFTNAESCPSIGTKKDDPASASPSTQYKEAGEFATKASGVTTQSGQTSFHPATTDDEGEDDQVLTPAENQLKEAVFEPLLSRGWRKVNENTLERTVDSKMHENRQYSSDSDSADAANAPFPLWMTGLGLSLFFTSQGILVCAYKNIKAGQQNQCLNLELYRRTKELVTANAEIARLRAEGLPQAAAAIIARVERVEQHLRMPTEEPSGAPPEYTSPIIGTVPARQPTANEPNPAGGEGADSAPQDPFVGGGEGDSIQMRPLLRGS